MDLTLLVLQQFGIDPTTIDINKNFRFRAYDEKKKAKLTVFDQFDETLMRLKFNFATVLMIEIKNDEEEFEEYDPDWIFLRAIKYEEGIDYDLSK